MFNVYVASEKISDQFHPDVITPYHPSFTTVPIKLILHGLLLSGMCQVNVQGGGGGSHLYLSLSMSEPVKMIS